MIPAQVKADELIERMMFGVKRLFIQEAREAAIVAADLLSEEMMRAVKKGAGGTAKRNEIRYYWEDVKKAIKKKQYEHLFTMQTPIKEP